MGEKFKMKKLNSKKLALLIMNIVMGLFYINCAMTKSDDTNCHPEICPASDTVYVGEAITLAMDPMASNIEWSVNNSSGVEQWDPPSQSAITENFTPFILGNYNMRVEYDISGKRCSCEFDINAELNPNEFKIELTWDGMGDLDLHLNNPSMINPMTENWLTTNDCYSGNASTIWGASLDVDNSEDSGPEAIVLDKNSAAEGDYHIGVANVDYADDRTATVKIYCGDGNNPIVQVSRPMQTNDFWVVGTINSNNCAYVDIDGYRVFTP